jgi:hypothetical protein
VKKPVRSNPGRFFYGYLPKGRLPLSATVAPIGEPSRLTRAQGAGALRAGYDPGHDDAGVFVGVVAQYNNRIDHLPAAHALLGGTVEVTAFQIHDHRAGERPR